LDEVDRSGIRIASAARAAYTLYLQRTLRHATVIEADGLQGAFELFTTAGLDVLAGLKPRLLDDVAKMAGARLLPGRFTAVQQSIGVRKERAAAAAYLAAWVEELKRSELLSTLIDKHGARGLTIAR
jgi:polar amino acid transport system substrate-binding protein